MCICRCLSVTFWHLGQVEGYNESLPHKTHQASMAGMSLVYMSAAVQQMPLLCQSHSWRAGPFYTSQPVRLSCPVFALQSLTLGSFQHLLLAILQQEMPGIGPWTFCVQTPELQSFPKSLTSNREKWNEHRLPYNDPSCPIVSTVSKTLEKDVSQPSK